MESSVLGQLRKMEGKDLEQVLAWRNHSDVRRFMYTTHVITLAEHTTWFEKAANDSKRHLLVYEPDGEPQGFLNLHELAPGVADWGFYLSPDAPKGTGQALGRDALQHAFSILSLHKICGQVLQFNERSIRFHSHLGFQEEGVLRDQHFNGTQYQNIVCFGLLDSEWKAQRGNK